MELERTVGDFGRQIELALVSRLEGVGLGLVGRTPAHRLPADAFTRVLGATTSLSRRSTSGGSALADEIAAGIRQPLATGVRTVPPPSRPAGYF